MGSAVAGGLMGGALGGAAGIGPQTRGPAPDPAPDMFSPEAESVAAPILDETVTPAEPEAEPAAAPAEPVAAVEPEPPTAAPVTPDEVREAVTDYILSPLTEAAETAAAEAGVDLEAVETPTKFYDERMESEDVDLGADEADLAAPGDTAADAAFAGDPASALVGVKEEIAWRRAELNGMTDAELRHEMQTAKFMADAGHGPKLEDTPHGDVLNAWLAAGREGRKVRETAAGAKPEPDAPEEVAAAEAVEKGPKAPQPVTEPVTEPAAEPEPEKPPAPSLVKPEPEKKPEPEPVEPPPETERPAAEKGSPEEYREAAEHYRKLRTLEEGPAPGPAPQPEPAAAPAGPTGRARAPRSVKELGERLTGAAAAAETLPPSKARREARKRADAVAVKEKKAREERAENLKKPATIKSRIKSQPVGKDVAESIKYRTLAGDARASRAGETWEETQRREFGSTVEELAEQDEKQNKIDFDKRVKGEPIVESDDPVDLSWLTNTEAPPKTREQIYWKSPTYKKEMLQLVERLRGQAQVRAVRHKERGNAKELARENKIIKLLNTEMKWLKGALKGKTKILKGEKEKLAKQVKELEKPEDPPEAPKLTKKQQEELDKTLEGSAGRMNVAPRRWVSPKILWPTSKMPPERVGTAGYPVDFKKLSAGDKTAMTLTGRTKQLRPDQTWVSPVTPDDLKIDPEMSVRKGAEVDPLSGKDKWIQFYGDTLVTVWKNPDGEYVVADGARRVALARRMKERGQPVVLVRMVIRDSKDGWTKDVVRREALLRNVNDGTAAPLDAARMVRDGIVDITHLVKRGVPADSGFIREVQGLSQLTDGHFKSVEDGTAPVPSYAMAEAGRMTGREYDDAQDAAVSMLDAVFNGPKNRKGGKRPPRPKADGPAAAQAAVLEATRADFSKQVLLDVQGTADGWADIAAAKAVIFANFARVVRRDRRVFNAVARHYKRKPAPGSFKTDIDFTDKGAGTYVPPDHRAEARKIRSSYMDQLAAQAGAMTEILSHFATVPSDVGKGLTQAAVQLNGGSSLSDATKFFYARLNETEPFDFEADKDAVWALAAEAVDEFAKGLAAVFPVQRLGMGLSFDSKDLARARVHFGRAWSALRAAGFSAGEASVEVLGRILKAAKGYKRDPADTLRSILAGWGDNTGRSIKKALGLGTVKGGTFTAADDAAREVWEYEVNPRAEDKRGPLRTQAKPEKAAYARPVDASIEVGHTAAVMQESVLRAMDKAGQETVVLPGGIRVTRGDVSDVVKFRSLLQSQIGHLPNWMAANKKHLKFPRSVFLQYLGEAEIGLKMAENRAVAAHSKDVEARKEMRGEIRKEMAKLSAAWVPGRKGGWVEPKKGVELPTDRVRIDTLRADVLSVYVNRPDMLPRVAPKLFAAIQRQADRSETFADVMVRLQKEFAGPTAENFINYTEEVLRAGRKAAGKAGWARVEEAVSAKMFFRAHPFDAAMAWYIRPAMKDLWRWAFDSAAGVVNIEKKMGRGELLMRRVSSMLRSLRHMNHTPELRRHFEPIYEIIRDKGIDPEAQQYLLLHRVMQGDPEWDEEALKGEIARRQEAAKVFTKEAGKQEARLKLKGATAEELAAAREQMTAKYREATASDWETLASTPAAVFITEKLNPGGLTKERAEEVLAAMKERLSADTWAALEDIGSRIEDANMELIDFSVKSGIMTEKQAALLRTSKKYVPYSMVEHADPAYVTPLVLKRKGSVGDIYSPIVSMAHKMASTWTLGRRNLAMQELRGMVTEADGAGVDGADIIELGTGDTQRQSRDDGGNLQLTPAAANRVQREYIRSKKRHDKRPAQRYRKVKWDAIRVYDKGVITDYAVEKAVADVIRNSPAPGATVKFFSGLKNFSRRTYLTWNPAWVFIRNPIMDTTTAQIGLHAAHPDAPASVKLRGSLKFYMDWWQAFYDGDFRTVEIMKRKEIARLRKDGGKEALKRVEALERVGLFAPEVAVEGQDPSIAGRSAESLRIAFRDLEKSRGEGYSIEAQIEERLAAEAAALKMIPAFDIMGLMNGAAWLRDEIDAVSSKWIGRIETATKTASAAYAARVKLTQRTGKSAGQFPLNSPAMTRELENLTPAEINLVRSALGSPDYHTTGTGGRTVNLLAQFSGPAVNSMTAFGAIASSPATRLGVFVKFAVTAVPTILNGMIRAGVGVAALRAAAEAFGEDPPADEDSYPEGIEEYRKRLEAVPSHIRQNYFYMPLFMDGHGDVGSVKIPIDHNLRFPLSVLDQAIDTAGRAKDDTLGTYTYELHGLVSSMLRAFPGATWWIPAAGAWVDIAAGQQTFDNYRRVPIFSRDEMESMHLGQKAWRGVKYTAHKMGLLDFDRVREPKWKPSDGALHTILRVPFAGNQIGSLVSLTDSGISETMFAATSKVRAREKGVSASRREYVREYGKAAAGDGPVLDPLKAAMAFYLEHWDTIHEDGAVTEAKVLNLQADLAIASFAPMHINAVQTLRTGTPAEAAAKAKAMVKSRVDPMTVAQAAAIYAEIDPGFPVSRRDAILMAVLEAM